MPAPPGASKNSPPARVPPPPPPPPAQPNAQESKEPDAVLLIRAMIAAANADGVIDAQERALILEKLQSVDLSEAEHQFIVHELLAPKGLQEIVDAAGHTDLSQQVYAASMLAVTVDTDAERQYMSELAEKLGLDTETVAGIHQQIGR